MKLAPSILSCDFSRLGEEVRAVEEGGADWIHIDVMDGHFVPNLTMGPIIVAGVRRATRLPLDVHLMIEDPDRYLDAFVQAGADLITVHLEACRHLHRTIHAIRDLGARAGVALNPATSPSVLEEVVGDLDLVLVMSVNPGFGGQVFIPETLGKVRRVRSLLGRFESDAEVSVDGGVGSGNARDLMDAGAGVMVAGASVYGHEDGPAAGVRALRAALGG